MERLQGAPPNHRSPEQALAAAAQLCRAGRLSEAAALCRDILMARPDWPPALCLSGEIMFLSGRQADGIAAARRALAAASENPHYHFTLGKMCVVVGRLDEARREFEQAIALNPREAAYFFALCLPELTTFAAGDPHLQLLEDLARSSAGLPAAAQIHLRFALARVYDDLGRYEESFRQLAQGNLLQRRRVVFDETLVRDMFERIRAAFDPALLAANADNGCRSPLPVFIVGMPRSGGSLVEQILASHPAVHGAGELNEIMRLSLQFRPGSEGFPESFRSAPGGRLRQLGERYLAAVQALAPEAARITDKAAALFMYVGVIALALPEARIVHVRRSPLDTCLSCYTTLFNQGQEFAYDLGELGRHYRRYAGLMAHWRDLLPPERLLEIDYEDVIADLAGAARRLVDFCGLPWDARCLAFYAASRPVFTASAAQVRRPIYVTARGRWRRYRDQLGPLVAALGDLADSD